MGGIVGGIEGGGGGCCANCGCMCGLETLRFRNIWRMHMPIRRRPTALPTAMPMMVVVESLLELLTLSGEEVAEEGGLKMPAPVVTRVPDPPAEPVAVASTEAGMVGVE